MKYQIDHDIHIHSYISPCAGHDPRMTAEAILAYGIASGLHLVCVTDHIWDKDGPGTCTLWRGQGLDFDKGKEILPLPQSEKCRFIFGIEADLDSDGNLAVTEKDYDTFDFIIVSPSHMHIFPPEYDENSGASLLQAYKDEYKRRLNMIFEMNLPFEKCGLAHFTTSLACRKDPDGFFDSFSDEEYREIFGRAAKLGMGIEINLDGRFLTADEESFRRHLRPYFIAKEAGCTFYFGSDCHTPDKFDVRIPLGRRAVDALGLTEDDKFPLVKKYIHNSGIN